MSKSELELTTETHTLPHLTRTEIWVYRVDGEIVGRLVVDTDLAPALVARIEGTEVIQGVRADEEITAMYEGTITELKAENERMQLALEKLRYAFPNEVDAALSPEEEE